MQTFLPYDSFSKSARSLDNKRLGKQRVEAKQIYLSLTVPTYGWKNHPAVKMWKGYHDLLAIYGASICYEWTRRGFKDSLYPWFKERMTLDYEAPKWIGMEAFHHSHQSNLLRKDYDWYSQWGWTVSSDLPYYWPVT